MNRVFSLVAILLCFSLSACNTMHGFGQDMSKVGGAISGAAK